MAPGWQGPALLFCPADRPERYQKAAERADAVILDLEDAVAPEDKELARRTILAQMETTGFTFDPRRIIVRINPAGTEEFDLDLQCLSRTPYRTLMLAKTEEASQIRALESYDVVALCETAAGIVNASPIAAEPNVVALMWGAEDLVASLGGTSSRTTEGRYRAVAMHARSAVLLAGGAAGKHVIDSVFVDIANLSGLVEEAADGVASGFASKACIHPNQVPIVRAAYAPTSEEVAGASELLNAATNAGNGVFTFNGKMIDGPILKHAQAMLRRADVGK